MSGPGAGDELGGWRLVERLGRGGMGAVFRAEDPRGRRGALKLLDPGLVDDEVARQRFAGEVELLRRLEHPRIVRALSGLLEAEGQPYYVMELVEGQDLARLLRGRGKLGPRDALRVAEGILEALEYAHGEGILHRDVKPANVFLERGGRARLGDFGLAHALGDTRLTRTGSVIGTPEYMAPEQAEGGTLDARTDVYAVGVLLHEMLSGEAPFRAAQPLAVLRMQVERAPPPLPAGIPAPLAALVARALAKDPARRFPDARAMRRAVRALRKVVAHAARSSRRLPPAAPAPDARAALVAAETAELGAAPVGARPAAGPPRADRAVPRDVPREAREPREVVPARRASPLLVGTGAAGGLLLLGLVPWLMLREGPRLPGPSAPERPAPASPAPTTPAAPLASEAAARSPEAAARASEAAARSPEPPAPPALTEHTASAAFEVELRDGTRLLASAVELAGEELTLRLPDGGVRRLELSGVAGWRPRSATPRQAGEPRPGAAPDLHEVVLRSGERYRARLLGLDLQDEALLLELPDGTPRRERLADVASYERIAPR